MSQSHLAPCSNIAQMFIKRYLVFTSASLLTLLIGGVPLLHASEVSGTIDQEIYSSKMSIMEIEELAKKVTVKVLSGDNEGSGIIIRRQGDSYFVLTNDHVLKKGAQNRITTSDGKIHRAIVNKSIKFGKNDLGLLRFASPKNTYSIAKLNSSMPAIGEEVYASGFPSSANTTRKSIWKFTSGRVVFFAKPSLEEGYELGYSNDIDKGMSGGPVIDIRGNLVAVNGIHAYPLWGDPYIYENGAKPCLQQRQEMRKVSWAIPISKYINAIQPQPLEDSRLINQVNIFKLSEPVPFINLEMMLKAELVSRCLPFNLVPK